MRDIHLISIKSKPLYQQLVLQLDLNRIWGVGLSKHTHHITIQVIFCLVSMETCRGRKPLKISLLLADADR
jgi:hypothetical protein